MGVVIIQPALPYCYNLLLRYKITKLLLGFDYSMQNWSVFNSFGQSGLLKNSERISVGLQYIPNKGAGSKEPYFKKIYYRIGFRYTDTYLELKNTALKDFAVEHTFPKIGRKKMVLSAHRLFFTDAPVQTILLAIDAGKSDS